MKKCLRCGEIKELSLFGSHKGKKDGKQQWCVTCMQKYLTEYMRKKHTGFEQHEYDDKFNEQKGCCAICGKHQSELKHAMSADHCHKTGTKRKLLCFSCNTGLGKFNDDIVLLSKAIKYLEEN